MADRAPKEIDVDSGADLVEDAASCLDAAIVRLQLIFAAEDDDPGCLERRHFATLERDLRKSRRHLDVALSELGRAGPNTLLEEDEAGAIGLRNAS